MRNNIHLETTKIYPEIYNELENKFLGKHKEDSEKIVKELHAAI